MSVGPPFDQGGASKSDWRHWRESTASLDIPGRDVRIIFPEQAGVSGPECSPAVFGDFDPNPDDPDPDVWPIEHLDPGYPAPVSKLTMIANTFPAPHVAWVTEDYLEAQYGYNPTCVEVAAENLPFWARPEGVEGEETVEMKGSSQSSMTLTDDRLEALRRIANLWNGEVVQGYHLLLDKCPSWGDVLGDLDQEQLRRLVVDPDVDAEFAERFSDHEWYEDEQSVYLKPQRILRKKVWYAPTQKGRTLIDRSDRLPDLTGDPKELLRHRFTVGLTALLEATRERKVATYYDLSNYVVDVVSQDSNDRFYVGEIITGHNNWRLHRRTYLKLKDLHSKGAVPYVVFDSRSTAYEVINHWHRAGLAQLPNGPFGSEPNISYGREKIQEAYRDEHTNWTVSDWQTTDTVWRETLGSKGPDLSTDFVTSLNW